MTAFERAVQAVIDSPPKEYTHEEAVALLQRYGVLNEDGALTEEGEQIFSVKKGQKKPTLTNYDRLISKSPEEIAEWIVATFPDNYCVPYSKGFKEDCDGVNCNICNCWVEWLKQEVDG